jgi:hypothetical protein
LSDIESKNISGGKTFSVKRVDGLLRRYGVIDDREQLYAKCFTQSGAELECETLQKTDIYLTIKINKFKMKPTDNCIMTPIETIQY